MLTIREEFEVLRTDRNTLNDYWNSLNVKRESLKKQLLEAEYAVKEVELTRELAEFEFDDLINEDRSNGRNGQWTNEAARTAAKRRMCLESETWKDANNAVEKAKFKVERLKADLADIENNLKKLKPQYEAITAELKMLVALQEAATAHHVTDRTFGQTERRMVATN